MSLLGPMSLKSLSNRSPGPHFVAQKSPIWNPPDIKSLSHRPPGPHFAAQMSSKTTNLEPPDIKSLSHSPPGPHFAAPRPPIWNPQNFKGGPAAEALALYPPRCFAPAGRCWACRVFARRRLFKAAFSKSPFPKPPFQSLLFKAVFSKHLSPPLYPLPRASFRRIWAECTKT